VGDGGTVGAGETVAEGLGEGLGRYVGRDCGAKIGPGAPVESTQPVGVGGVESPQATAIAAATMRSAAVRTERRERRESLDAA
jgi:hypothetical protein